MAAAALLGADVLILQEAARPAEVSPTDDAVWLPINGRYGVAIVTRNGYTVRPSAGPRGLVACRAAEIGGRAAFGLLAVWTHQSHGYIAGLAADLRRARNWMAGRPVVLAGDLNSNAIWDRASRPVDHSRVVARLAEEFGLVSAYHLARGVKQGEEPEPTYYWQWNEAHPFHLDYCFVPAGWRVQAVTVGGFAEWAGVSDHRPVVVDVKL